MPKNQWKKVYHGKFHLGTRTHLGHFIVVGGCQQVRNRGKRARDIQESGNEMETPS